MATWDGRFPGGGTFTAILQPKAYTELKIPSKEKGKDAVKPPPGSERDVVGRHIDEHRPPSDWPSSAKPGLAWCHQLLH